MTLKTFSPSAAATTYFWTTWAMRVTNGTTKNVTYILASLVGAKIFILDELNYYYYYWRLESWEKFESFIDVLFWSWKLFASFCAFSCTDNIQLSRVRTLACPVLRFLQRSSLTVLAARHVRGESLATLRLQPRSIFLHMIIWFRYWHELWVRVKERSIVVERPIELIDWVTFGNRFQISQLWHLKNDVNRGSSGSGRPSTYPPTQCKWMIIGPLLRRWPHHWCGP